MDKTAYWFRVRAVNNKGAGSWSNPVSIRINQQHPPSISLTAPANGAVDQSKTPTLTWQGVDLDGDALDYAVELGTNPASMSMIRGFAKQGYEGQPSLNVADEYGSLLPNTTYYWRVKAREVGFWQDHYGGSYPMTATWSFTTVATGPALSYSGITALDPIGPNREVRFKITVSNPGTEATPSLVVGAAYQKNSTESEFSTTSGVVIDPLAPSASRDLTVGVTFKSEVWISPWGTVYDNVLTSGSSGVRFYLKYPNPQLVSQPSVVVPITYSNSAPQVTDFDLRSNGRSMKAGNLQVIQGGEINIVANEHDDLKTTTAIAWYRTASTDPWTELVRFTGNTLSWMNFSSATPSTPSVGTLTNIYGNSFSWVIPASFPITSALQVRLQYTDSDGQVSAMQESTPFPVVSNLLTVATGSLAKSTYTLGDSINIPLTITSGNAIYKVYPTLYAGTSLQPFPDIVGGTTSVTATLPTYDYFVHDHAFIRIRVRDVVGNEKVVDTATFRLVASSNLPSPFQPRIQTYSNNYAFPTNGVLNTESISNEAVALDEINSKVYSVIHHTWSYYLDQNNGAGEDLRFASDKYFFVPIDISTKAVSAPVEIPGSGTVVDMIAYGGIPYVLRMDQYNYGRRLFVQKWNGTSFDAGTEIQSQSAPSITSVSGPLSTIQNSDTWTSGAVANGYVISNGYIYFLGVSGNRIQRATFSNGVIGPITPFTLVGTIPNTAGYEWVRPCISGSKILFVDPSQGRAFQIDTSTGNASTALLPFTISTEADGMRTMVAISGGKIILVGNGHIYEWVGAAFVDRGAVAYTIGGMTADYSASWSTINRAVAFDDAGTLTFLICNPPTTAKPWPDLSEFLTLNASTWTVSKSIARVASSPDSRDSISFIGNHGCVSISSIGWNPTAGADDYRSSFTYLNAQTGDAVPLGDPGIRIPTQSSGYPPCRYVSAYNDGTNTYVISANPDRYGMSVFRVNFANLSSALKVYRVPRFVSRNGVLQVAWSMGVPWDGRFDVTTGKVMHEAGWRTWAATVSPSIQSAVAIANRDFGIKFDLVGDYISDTSGGVHHLTTALGYDAQVATFPLTAQTDWRLTAYTGSTEFGATTGPGTSAQILLASTGGSIVQMGGAPMYPRIATYAGYMLYAGSGISAVETTSTVVVKRDRATGTEIRTILGDGTNNDEKSIRCTALDSQGRVAVGWGKFLALGNFAGDIVPPTVAITSLSTTYVANQSQTITWLMSDNQNALASVEIQKLVQGNTTTLASFTSALPTSYTYGFADTADQITLRVLVKDAAGNAAMADQVFTSITPTLITSFASSASTIALGGSITLSWTTNKDDVLRTYLIDRQVPAGSGLWVNVATVVGSNSIAQTIADATGNVQFRIRVLEASAALTAPVVVTGDLMVLATAGLQPATGSIYLPAGQTVVPFSWQSTIPVSPSVMYTLLIKKNGESVFSAAAQISDLSARIDLGNATSFSWKIRSIYAGTLIESAVQDVAIAPLVPPVLTAVTAQGQISDAPSVLVSFTPATGITSYSVLRSTDSSQAEIIASTDATGSFVDAGVSFGHAYTYRLISTFGEWTSTGSNAMTTTVTLAGMPGVVITTPDNQLLTSNSINLAFEPSIAGSFYENYQICLGSSLDTLAPLTTTRLRTATVSNLRYNTNYMVGIYPIDPWGRRLSGLPATISFTTGFDTRTLAAISGITVTEAAIDRVGLSWLQDTNADEYQVFRSVNGGSMTWIGSVTNGSVIDTNGLVVGSTYQYQVKAVNGNTTVLSSLSPLVTITATPAVVSDLRITRSASTALDLQWTAPNGAASYQLRYTSDALIPETWSDAMPVTGVPTPATAGGIQSMTVAGLDPMKLYRFAIVSSDSGAHRSGLSNVVLGVTSDNAPPVATAGSFTISQSAVYLGTLSASDAEHDALTYSIQTNPGLGTVEILDSSLGTFQYTAPASAGATSFTFVAADATGQSSPATVSVTITANPVNHAPSANAVTLAVARSGTITATLTGSDPDGQIVSTYTLIGTSTKGAATLNPTTGAFSFVASATASGVATLAFTVSDGALTSTPASITIAITGANSAPSVTNSSISVVAGQSISGLLSATDAEGDPLSFAIIGQSPLGVATLTNASTGAFSFAAASGTSGTTAFSFQATDGISSSPVGVVTVTVQASGSGGGTTGGGGGGGGGGGCGLGSGLAGMLLLLGLGVSSFVRGRKR